GLASTRMACASAAGAAASNSARPSAQGAAPWNRRVSIWFLLLRGRPAAAEAILPWIVRREGLPRRAAVGREDQPFTATLGSRTGALGRGHGLRRSPRRCAASARRR